MFIVFIPLIFFFLILEFALLIQQDHHYGFFSKQFDLHLHISSLL